MTEAGSYGYNVRLGAAPTSQSVNVAVTSTGCSLSEGSSLTFTTANWNVAQKITVKTEKDSAFTLKDSVAYQCTLTHSVQSSDDLYKASVMLNACYLCSQKDAVLVNISVNSTVAAMARSAYAVLASFFRHKVSVSCVLQRGAHARILA